MRSAKNVTSTGLADGRYRPISDTREIPISEEPKVQITSEAIAEAVQIAVQHGNAVKVISSDWKPKQVVFMAEPLEPKVRAAIHAARPELAHYVSERTPHNPADEGFVARNDDVVISFPKAGERFRWY